MLNVCRTLSCALLGAERVTEELSAKLGIKPGETDPSGTFTLVEVECLGACDRAPVVMVNDDWHEAAVAGAVLEVRRRHPRARQRRVHRVSLERKEKIVAVIGRAFRPADGNGHRTRPDVAHQRAELRTRSTSTRRTSAATKGCARR